jgi:hypothetical protein
MTKELKCSACKEVLPTSAFSKHRSHPRGYQYRCKKCTHIQYDTGGRREYHAQYIKGHKEEITKREKQFRKNLKREVFNYYGKVCACCGESHIVFLTLDHINEDGAEHRRKIGAGEAIYRWVKKNKYPSGFQVLCFNCNFAKSNGGCPHKEVATSD